MKRNEREGVVEQHPYLRTNELSRAERLRLRLLAFWRVGGDGASEAFQELEEMMAEQEAMTHEAAAGAAGAAGAAEAEAAELLETLSA